MSVRAPRFVVERPIHRGASKRLLHKAHRFLDPDEVFALAEPDGSRPADRIRYLLGDFGTAYQDAVIDMWTFLYAGGPSPVGDLSTQRAASMWQGWFDANGLAPSGLYGTHDYASPSLYALRPASGPEMPQESPEPAMQPSVGGDAQARQAAAVEAWRAEQLRTLRALWQEGFAEGAQNFAEQYPELATDDLLSELDAEDETDEEMAPHYASVAKIVGELTNLLMLAPAIPAIKDWFDRNERRMQIQAEQLAWQAEQRGYREAGSNMGLLIEWESENDERTCDDCASLADNSPYTTEEGDNPLPSFPGDGSTQCGPNCRCSLNYLEPDTTGLAEEPADIEQDAGDFAAASEDAVASALGADSLAEIEGISLRSTIRSITTRSANLDIEAGFALDREGNILAAALGDNDSVGFSYAQLQKSEGAAVSIHNHPLSTAFSPTDVAFAFTQRFGEMRVVSPKYEFTLKPTGPRFNPDDAKAVLHAAQSNAEQFYPAVAQQAHQIYASGTAGLTFDAAFKQASVDFWHDVWTATSKETGLFTYTRAETPRIEQIVHVTPKTVTQAQIHEENLKALGQLPADFPSAEQDIHAMTTIPGPSGANVGFWKRDAAGHEYYVKEMSSERAANEVGAMRAYELMGAVPGQDIPYVTVMKRVDDKPWVISRKVPTAVTKSPLWWESPAAVGAKAEAKRLWAMDTLLSHYDVVGANPAKGFDNLLARWTSDKAANPTGIFRVEGGGAMAFSGLGNVKAGWKVGGAWVEPWTMRGIARDGVPGGPTVKPVFGQITDKEAAELLGKLKGLDIDALAKAWSDAGMKWTAIVDNLAVVNYRLSQIDAVQAALGFTKPTVLDAVLTKTPIAPAPPATIASQVAYKAWSPKTDKWAKDLIVQLKPLFEDFKQFSPVAGKVSDVVSKLIEATGGLQVPASVSAKPDVYARTLRRVAFGRSFNMALLGKYDDLPPDIAAFWKTKLGVTPQLELKVGKPVAVVEKPTSVQPWNVNGDPLGTDFALAHPDWFAGWSEHTPFMDQQALVGTVKPAASQAFAMSYHWYLHNPEGLKTISPKSFRFWETRLGSLPAQTEHLQPAAEIAKTEQAVKAATAGPYDQLVSDMKDEIVKTGDPEDALAGLGEIYVKEKMDPSEMIDALVKFNVAGNDESAANMIAEWMANYTAPAEPPWGTPPSASWVQQKHPGLWEDLSPVHASVQIESMYSDYVGGEEIGAAWQAVFKEWDAQQVAVTPAYPAGTMPVGSQWSDFVHSEGFSHGDLEQMWQHIYADTPLPLPAWGYPSPTAVVAWKEKFEEKGFGPHGSQLLTWNPTPGVEMPLINPAPSSIVILTPATEASVEAVSVTKVDQLYGLLKADWPDMAGTVSPADLGAVIADYQQGKASESWTAWLQQHAPEIAAIQGPESEVLAPSSSVSFTAIAKTLLAWSPKNDKWGKKFSATHPKFYESFRSAFKTKTWVQTITPELQFPAHWIEQRKTRLRLKVALARTYNMAISGKYAELEALDPKLSLWWKAKLGDLAPAALKVPVAIQADLANLQRVKEQLRVSNPAWYGDFRSTFGHSVTLKIVPELSTADIPIPANGTRERELRSLAFAKTYLMAQAGDVAGLKAIDENLLYFWDEKLGGGLAPKVVVALEGAPWIEELNALYGKGDGTSALESKFGRSTRSADWNAFKSAIHGWTNGTWDNIRAAAKTILRGGAGGTYAKHAKALIEAIQDAPNTAPLLTRRESASSVAERAGIGRDVTMQGASAAKQALIPFFREKIGTDYTFTMDLVSTQYHDHWSGDLKWVIEKGSQAIYAKPYSVHSTENEFITAGRYSIQRVEEESGTLVIYVRQVGVFDLPE